MNHSKERLLTAQEKLSYNKELFGVVAPRYNLITRILSLGMDRRWKKILISALPHVSAPTCLDIACGTGDLSFALAKRYKQGRVVGIDISSHMLNFAHKKNMHHDQVSFMVGDMCQLPFADGSFDVVTGGYALRNAPDLKKALYEIQRVLKPGGHAAFLDFSKPVHPSMQRIYYYVLKWWGNLWGMLLHQDPGVYGYIAQSLAHYPHYRKLNALCADYGLELVYEKSLMGGICRITIVSKFR